MTVPKAEPSAGAVPGSGQAGDTGQVLSPQHRTHPRRLFMAPRKGWTTFMSSVVNSRGWRRRLSGLRSVISAITSSNSSLNRYCMHFYYVIFWSKAIKNMAFVVYSTRKCALYWFLCVYLRVLFILCYLFHENEDTENPMWFFYCSEKYPSSLYFEPPRRMTSHIPIFLSYILVSGVPV